MGLPRSPSPHDRGARTTWLCMPWQISGQVTVIRATRPPFDPLNRPAVQDRGVGLEAAALGDPRVAAQLIEQAAEHEVSVHDVVPGQFVGQHPPGLLSMGDGIRAV